MDAHKEIEQLATDFEQCRKVLIALGDENRQHMILEMTKNKSINFSTLFLTLPNIVI